MSSDGPNGTDPAFAFMFSGEEMAVEAETLAAALRARPDLSADRLEEVWCLRSCNCVWGFVGDPRPWRDPEPANA